ncbi:Shedu immune nuclease family protein [Variovorax boronicumulans]|uniref:Shedu immune nuclease family protein n=1 Tax=Variovorax boronicumulans TaxID=436515 RepID=UPI001C56AE35
MADDEEIHRNKLTGKTYISPQIPTLNGPLRIASKVIDSEGAYYAKVKKEVVLRRTPAARTEIVAKFLEDDRKLTVLTLQQFNGNNGQPHRTNFSFVGSEIPKLLSFLNDIAEVEFQHPGAVNITDADLHRLVLSKAQAATLVHDNQEVFLEALKSEVTKNDIVALGYRKKQLGVFSQLLSDPEFFDQCKRQKSIKGDEPLWQAFFEKNPWVFGYGLSYFYVTGFEERKLEQVVQGYDLLNRGKRADAVMKTKGIINSLCFVEIKHHNTKLLESDSYRPGCWAPSKEMGGAVAQVQATVAIAMHRLHGMQRMVDSDGNLTGEDVFNFKPRAFIVIGSLNEFVGEHGVNQDKLRSFELYRASLSGIDILTFDELYERSKFIVDSAHP